MDTKRKLNHNNVYSLFITDIVHGRIRPGERLGEESLASRWKVGRSAVREALFRLEQDGILIRKPKVGTFVRKIDEKELLEIYDIRAVLESMVAAKVAEIISDNQLDELRKLADRTDNIPDETFDRDQKDFEFHMKLCEISGLKHIPNLLRLGHLHSLCYSYNHQLALLRGFIHEPIHRPDHRDIVEVLRKHNPELAGKIMHKHLIEAKKGCEKDIELIKSRLNSPVDLVNAGFGR